MWGHLFQLLRDIAVNESDQERVSDSGAIRSGLVPQLKHNAIHRRALPRPEDALKKVSRLWPMHCNRRSRVNAPSTGRRSEMRQQARKISGSLALADAHGRMSRRARTGAQRDIPSICATIAHRSRSIGRDAASCSDCLRADRHYLCTGDLAWSFSRDANQPDHACGRIRADDNRGRYANYGFEMGVCRTWWKRVSYASEMHARLKALLERMAIDLNARLDPVSAIL
jgi:hypothetical protein